MVCNAHNITLLLNTTSTQSINLRYIDVIATQNTYVSIVQSTVQAHIKKKLKLSVAGLCEGKSS